jgi:hypothetical protein
LERAVGVACLRWRRQAALVAAVLRLLVITLPIVTAIVVPTTASVVAAVVIVATQGRPVPITSGALWVFERAERPLELLALANCVGAPFMECIGAIQHRVELLDVERRRSVPICREHF